MHNISKTELQKGLKQHEDMLVVDVLPRESFEKKHIPGSISIPYKDNPNFTKQVEGRTPSKDQRVIVYCANAHCDLSKRAAQELLEAGFANVHTYEEGVEGWFKSSKVAA